MRNTKLAFSMLLASSILVACGSTSPETGMSNVAPTPEETESVAKTTAVTLENFKIAESNVAFNNIAKTGGVNKFFHFPVTAFDLDNQTVVRMNQDTIYSAAIVDVSKGATITLPDTNGRYQSVMVVQNDHYINDV